MIIGGQQCCSEETGGGGEQSNVPGEVFEEEKNNAMIPDHHRTFHLYKNGQKNPIYQVECPFIAFEFGLCLANDLTFVSKKH